MKMAYMILAHRDDAVLRMLLQMLDCEDNDIFIHMDVKNKGYSPEAVEGSVKKCRIYHTPRTDVAWGSYSLVRAEMLLLKTAVAHGPYSYFHMLSGQDLPIKSQTRIRAFFEENQGAEFVSYDGPEFLRPERVYYRYRIQEKVGRNYGLLFRLQQLDVGLQKMLKRRRNTDIAFQKGCNWFSITWEFARYVTEREDWVERVFDQGCCVDEIFLQTLLLNSPFRDRQYPRPAQGDSSMRYIDWNRGAPYTFRSEDYRALMDSPMMFARKFQESVDMDIVRRIRQTCTD